MILPCWCDEVSSLCEGALAGAMLVGQSFLYVSSLGMVDLGMGRGAVGCATSQLLV